MKFGSQIFYNPENGSGNGGPPGGAGQADFPDLGPQQDVGGDFDQGLDPNFNYVEDAYRQMQTEEGFEAPQQQPQPQYPQPVVPPGQRQQPQRQAVPSQQRQTPGQLQQPQQAPQAPQVSVQAQQPQLTPEQQAQQAQQQRMDTDPFAVQADIIHQQQQQFVDQLAQNVYPISNEDMDAFLSGDGTKVSQALARVHVNAVGSVMKAVSQYMPVWVGNMLKLHSQAREREDGFWNMHPDLDRTKHNDLAIAAANAFKQMNPTADIQTMYKMVGAMVAAASGIQLRQNLQRPPAQQFHTGPNGVRTPGPVVRRTSPPFQPAGMAARGGGVGPAPIENPWAVSAEIIQADDRGVLTI